MSLTSFHIVGITKQVSKTLMSTKRSHILNKHVAESWHYKCELKVGTTNARATPLNGSFIDIIT